MEWKIYSADGTEKCTAYSVEYSGAWMGEEYVLADITSPYPVPFEIGDWILYRGERYEINYEPEVDKNAQPYTTGKAFEYKSIKFNSFADELTRCDFLDYTLNDNGMHYSGLPTFPFYAADITDFADRVQANLDRMYKGNRKWTVEVHPEYSGNTDVNIQIDKSNVWNAISSNIGAFGVNFIIRGRRIIFGTAGIPADHLFKMGVGNGLKKISRASESDQQIITRLRVYGSERNLPRRYYNSLSGADGKKFVPDNMAVKNLMLPDFPGKTLDPYLDSPNISAIGVREGSVFFDGSDDDHPEIYPSIEEMTAEELNESGIKTTATGRLDEILGADKVEDNGVGTEKNGEIVPDTERFKITVKDWGFDINDYWTEETAVISFKSGMLGGREFEIVQSGNDKPRRNADGSWTLTLLRVYDEDIQLFFPYKSYNAAPSDRFVILHITMPDVYIKAAQQRLKKKGEEFLSKNDYARSSVSLDIDETVMAEQHRLAVNSNGKITSIHDTIKAGDILVFEDTDLGFGGESGGASITIDSITIREGSTPIPTYEVTLREEKTVGTIEKMQQQIDSIKGGQGSGGYNAAQIKQLISLYGLGFFLSKTRDDRTPYKLTAGGGFEVGEFLAGLYGGTGAGIDAKGNAEFESAVIRTSLTIMELIVNQQTVEQGDVIYTEGDTIEEVEYDGLNADGTQRWWVTIKPRYDGYTTAIAPGMVIMGKVNNLFNAADGSPATYYTSFMRVNGAELGTDGNRLNVTVYSDDEVPSGENHPPCELMVVARWGHETLEQFQRLFRLSSHDGTLVRYEGVTKPIVDLTNVASFIGKAPAGWFASIPGVKEGDEIAYFKTLLGNFIQVDHQLKPVPTYVYAGDYDPNKAYRFEAWENGAFITEYVGYCGCLWLCRKDLVKGIAPDYGTTAWAFYQGNATFRIDFEEKQVCYMEDDIQNFGATLTLTATMYNQDVLSRIPAANVHWSRESYDSLGALRAASDAAWTPTTDSDNKRLLLTAADLDYDGTPISKITIRCTAAIDDTTVAAVETSIS